MQQQKKEYNGCQSGVSLTLLSFSHSMHVMKQQVWAAKKKITNLIVKK